MLRLIPIYLSYFHYMQNDDGSFRNFLGYNREYLDDIGTEDSTGRAIWALGYLIRYAPKEVYFQLGRELFIKAFPHFENVMYTRGIANHIIGISHYLHRFPSDEGMVSLLKNLAYRMIELYDANKGDDWCWFEKSLTYDNGILPLALFHAYEILGHDRLLTVGLESMQFLKSLTFREGYISLIGSDNWYRKAEERSQYAQQPIDAMAMVLMFHQAYVVTKNKDYLKDMSTAFQWFLGENDLRISLYDFETKGCCDGLECYGVNRNQGAESTLAYCISHLAVLLENI